MVVPEFAGLGEGSREEVDDIEEQRLKNNMAVKRSRMKSRQKMSQMVDRSVFLRISHSFLPCLVSFRFLVKTIRRQWASACQMLVRLPLTAADRGCDNYHSLG